MEAKFNVAELYLALFGEKPVLKDGAGGAVAKALSDLPPRERQVLTLRFGLVDGHVRTAEEIGHQFGVTSERIHLIEAQALSTVQNSKHSKLLKGFIK